MSKKAYLLWLFVSNRCHSLWRNPSKDTSGCSRETSLKPGFLDCLQWDPGVTLDGASWLPLASHIRTKNINATPAFTRTHERLKQRPFACSVYVSTCFCKLLPQSGALYPVPLIAHRDRPVGNVSFRNNGKIWNDKNLVISVPCWINPELQMWKCGGF